LFLASGLWGARRLLTSKKYQFGGRIVGANSKIGHLMRTGVSVKPTKFESLDTIIVGGGISGLSAAWWFRKQGFENFTLFEMDTESGGNSSSGSNQVSGYPWGAHYLPVPSKEAVHVRDFLEEIGAITGYEKGLPVFNEYYLCADSNERLFFQGEWQDGLVPQHGIQASDKAQYEEFFGFVKDLKTKHGKDQKPAFAIPVAFSSQDQEFLKLDQITMADYMKSRGWTSEYLNWYVNYCCRDDFGMPHNKVSAWAGITRILLRF
ncbi:MAG: NAD(P)/FAD-dependent oxidoreductase, partial [Proteobacteria bacterium]